MGHGGGRQGCLSEGLGSWVPLIHEPLEGGRMVPGRCARLGAASLPLHTIEDGVVQNCRAKPPTPILAAKGSQAATPEEGSLRSGCNKQKTHYLGKRSEGVPTRPRQGRCLGASVAAAAGKAPKSS